MKNKILNVGLIGRTNAGKSTLINSLVGEKISIENKKINTTLESIAGIFNFQNIQIVFYDTPGSNFLKTTKIIQKKIKTQIWETIDSVDLVLLVIDVSKYNYQKIINDIKKINEIKKPIIVVFNKIDLVNKDLILKFIKELDRNNIVCDFFNISAKYKLGLSRLIKYFVKKSKIGEWQYKSNEISNKSDVFISNECTRNALLKYLHKEIPYNISVKNIIFKTLNKSNIKIKQSIEIYNARYKSIILGKRGQKIKKIRESSQKEIEKIFNSKIHLYLEVVYLNAK